MSDLRRRPPAHPITPGAQCRPGAHHRREGAGARCRALRIWRQHTRSRQVRSERCAPRYDTPRARGPCYAQTEFLMRPCMACLIHGARSRPTLVSRDRTGGASFLTCGAPFQHEGVAQHGINRAPDRWQNRPGGYRQGHPMEDRALLCRRDQQRGCGGFCYHPDPFRETENRAPPRAYNSGDE